MITSVSGSEDLAVVLNTHVPLTEEDAKETPCDWIAGLWVGGEIYPLDPVHTTKTLAVLENGTAAVQWSPRGTFCHGTHRVGVDYLAAHWCAADKDEWTLLDDARGVTRDWRAVNVWDANGYNSTEVCPTLEEAKVMYDREVQQMVDDAETEDLAGGYCAL